MRLKIVFPFIIFLLSSCSSVKNISINTKQEKVKVEVFDFKENKFEEVGFTPLKLDPISKKSNFVQDELMHIKLSKPGYIGENFFLNFKGNSNLLLTSYLQKVESWTDPEAQYSNVVANSLIKKIQSINTLIKKGKLKVALSQLNTLIKKFPQAHILYDIKGSIYFIQGEVGRSIASYRKSLALNPYNPDTLKMVKYIEEQGGNVK